MNPVLGLFTISWHEAECPNDAVRRMAGSMWKRRGMVENFGVSDSSKGVTYLLWTTISINIEVVSTWIA